MGEILQNSISKKRLVFSKTLLLIFIMSSVLSLQTPTNDSIIPYSPYIMLGSQILIPSFMILKCKLFLSKRYDRLILIYVFLFILFFLSLLSAFYSKYPELVLQRTLMVFIPILLMGVLIWSDLNPSLTFILISRWLTVFATILSSIGIILFIFGVDGWIGGVRLQKINIGPFKLSQAVYGYPPLLRISSLTGNPNSLASWLLISIILTLYLIDSHQIKRIYGKIFLYIQFLSLILTFSRTGIISTLFAFILYLLLSTPCITKKILYIIIFIVLVGVFLYFVLPVLSNFDPMRFSFDLNEREQAWSLLLSAIRNKLLYGVGFGISYEAILEPNGIGIAAHSMHLQTISEIGLLGYVLVIIIWFFGVRNGLNKIKEKKEKRTAIAAVISLLIAIFLHQIFESKILRYDFYTMIWAYLCFLINHPYF